MTNTTEKTNVTGTKTILWICLVASVVIAGVWIWKSVQIADERKQFATQMQQLRDESLMQMRKADELYLRSMAKPMVWAIRTEMLKNNLSQVNLYAIEMVKEKNFKKVLIANSEGLVILSTNKKEEGNDLIQEGSLDYLLADSTVVETINDSLLIMSSPIMGFNSRLGTMVVSFAVRHSQQN